MKPTEFPDIVNKFALLLDEHGVTAIADAFATAVYVNGDCIRNAIWTCMGSGPEAHDRLRDYDLYVFAYQQMKTAAESIAEFVKDGADSLGGTYFPPHKR